MIKHEQPYVRQMFGPNIMIWPEGTWYMKVTKRDLPEIVENFLKLEQQDQKEQTAAYASPAK